jgi:hypothetical protein
MKTIVCVGTGPSLTMEQVAVARSKGFALYGCNLTFRDVPDLAVLHACNTQFWDFYADELKGHPAQKWTTRPEAAARYPWLNYISEIDRPGLSADPRVLHHGHSSGYQLVGLAYHHGAARILLIGFDLRFPSGYDGRNRIAGGKRHYFGDGEYPAPLQHWPSVQVRNGVHVELVELYRSVHEQGLVEIINCTPGSALEGVIPSMDIADVV